MTMSGRLGKFVLTAHIALSVGWLGAVAVVLALGVMAITSPNAQVMRGAYLVMEPTAWFVLVPLSIASLANRSDSIVGDPVGFVPALLGPFQASHKRVRQRHFADVHADAQLPCGDGCQNDVVRCRPQRAADSIGRHACKWRSDAVARGDNAVRVQAEGLDPVRTAQTKGNAIGAPAVRVSLIDRLDRGQAAERHQSS